MGFMDKVKDMLGQHGDKVSKGVDKAGRMADSKTKGKYSDKIRTGTQKAREQAEKLGRQEGGGKGPEAGGGHGKGPDAGGGRGKGPGGV
ncbi:antitoxin [Streptomyces ovatisporus]|uniref:Antitoxin n=1 Tax=Streptomyces ovatisporus TaxID=1128682 RepID=A0ABV9AD70_9ACTN